MTDQSGPNPVDFVKINYNSDGTSSISKEFMDHLRTAGKAITNVNR